ncbi:MAG: DUF5915 domain-containing protein, partial [candidate division KSB1 bacterium]|nr:DUF5915 domain-containing protein [candidate division KSB1 bacterium]
KMAKSRGNTVDPWEHLEREGADALRWYFMTVSPPWVPTRFDPQGVAEAMRKFLSTLVNVYSFFALYANIDGFRYVQPTIPVEQRPELDRWILSEFNALVGRVNRALERYDITRAARDISDFVIEDLSNWYVRRSRRRFWKSGLERDKKSAYETLYEVLTNVARLTAPFIPFLSEEIYRNLTRDLPDAADSVHLTSYPSPEAPEFRYRDEELERRMRLALDLVELGRSLRNRAGVKVRQPLPRILVVARDERQRTALRSVEKLVLDELNVKAMEFVSDPAEIAEMRAVPVGEAIQRRYRERAPAVAAAIEKLASEEVARLRDQGSVSLPVDHGTVEITPEMVEVIWVPKQPNLVVEGEEDLFAGLDTSITPELLAEGLAREFVNRVQNMRKEAGFNVTDRIVIYYRAPEEVARAVEKLADYVRSETLALKLIADTQEGAVRREWKVGGYNVTIAIERVADN